MKKSLLALAATAAGVALVAPKFIGDNADAQLNQVVAEFNDIPGYDLAIIRSDKGWFSSSSTLKFAFDPIAFDPSLAQTPDVEEMFDAFEFELKVDMQHGPILLNKGLGLSDIQVRIPNTSDDIKLNGELVENIYLFDGKLNLSGDLSYEDSISAMEFGFGEDAGKFDFSGYSGKAINNSGKLVYTAQAATLKITGPDMNFTLSDIATDWTGNFDLPKMIKGIYGDMESSLSIGKFEAKLASQPLFGWDNLELYFNNIVKENHVSDMHTGYSIAVLNTPIDKFEDIEITFEFNNLSQQVMEKYQEVFIAVQDPQFNEDQLLKDLTPAAIDILSHKPGIKITNIGFKTAAGTLKSQADIKLANYEFDASTLVNKAHWQNILLLDSSVTLPTALALDLAQKNMMLQFQADPGAAQYTPEQLQEIATQQAQMMLDNFMQGGFLVEQNGELQLNFTIKDGVANLNGQEIPLAALLPAQ